MSKNPTPSLERLLSHRTWVRGVARRLLRDEQAAEDLAQETWVRAMRSPPDPERDPKPWLRRVLKNLASNTRRGEGRRQKHEGAWRTAPEARSPDALVAEAEQHKRLVNVLMDLEEPFKTALVLRFYEGLGPKEIAGRLDVPVGTVHSRIARAVERMKKRLDEEENGNRRAWIAGLLPLAGLDRLAPAAAATAATTPLLTGILVMTLSKPKFALLATLLVGCLIGGGIWLASDSSGDDPGGAGEPALLVSDAAPTLEGRVSEVMADAGTMAAPTDGTTKTPADARLRVVQGIVRDAMGSAVSGAEVFALPKGAPGIDEEDLGDPRYGRTRTAEDGTFEVRLDTMRPTRLLALSKGHSAASIVLDDAATTDERIEITLGKPWRVRVRVANAQGAWPSGCEVDFLDIESDGLDRAVDPRRQAVDVELTSPRSGNVHEVALSRTGTVWVYVTVPQGMAAIPTRVELTQPTEEVSIRLVPSAQLTLRLFDAATGEPLAKDTGVVGWMGQHEWNKAVWNFGARGPVHTRRSNIAPKTYDLDVNAPGYKQWKGQVTIQDVGESRSIDIRLEPRGRDVSRGRLLLDVTATTKSPKALLEFAHLDGEIHEITGRYMMFLRMSEGDQEAWDRTWSTSAGWSDLIQIPRDDGSIMITQRLHGVLSDQLMPAGTYDLYVAERATGRAAFVSGVRVFGDDVNRYVVQLEPGTMFSSQDVLPGESVFTALEVRTAKTGSLPIIALHSDGSEAFNTPHSLPYLLRVPRKSIRLGPFPASAVQVRTVDANERERVITISGAGTLQR